MDLLDRVNALTDDQLQMVAERDDASGVLAAYALADRRGLPMPDREAVILCDGYVIVAQAGNIMKVPTNPDDALVTKIIREEGGLYCVYSEDGSRSFGCYDSMAGAEHRLQQIHWFDTEDEALLAKEVPTKRENGLDFPALAYAYVPDPLEPATWALRVWETPESMETREQIGRALGDLDSARIPASEVPVAQAGIQRALERLRERENAAVENAAPGDVREGTFVSWNSSGGRARGRIEYVMREGTLGVPESSFSINATPEDPAALIRVWRPGADGWAETETLVGHKVSTLTVIDSLRKETFPPPEGVQQAARRALDWIAEGHAGGGFTDTGRARAAQLARGDGVSEDTIRRIANYLSRHEGDARAEGFNAGEAGFPSPGRVAWDAWGGDPAVSWSNRIVERLNREQEKDGDIPLTPRQTLMYEKFEWIAETLGPWDGGVGADGAHYMSPGDNPFAEDGLNCANCVFYEGGGGCEILDMPVEPNGVCKLWIIPETALTVQADTGQAKAISRDARFLMKEAAQRFTLGPLYVPDFMDAHGEWTDADELQQAVWGWVQSENRTIYLQHDREVRAGEWVEVMTMPQPWTVTMMGGDGTPVGEVTYPEGTVFLGVIWDEGPWRDILAGNLRGYSIGGFSDRVLADLPNEASREGLSLDE